ncbi:unnamed protein product [Brassicogethes aeneus]|uniref:Uncharacterized protein n=1 Tax=Brassicogethes aeneus TaxID=1431903 RepID=A0A9P0AYE3_BRAAE|nr:unnamed protein product [Brassicogethes aeneus]
MYAKIETERLLYIRLNQTKLRCEEYMNLSDAVVNDGYGVHGTCIHIHKMQLHMFPYMAVHLQMRPEAQHKILHWNCGNPFGWWSNSTFCSKLPLNIQIPETPTCNIRKHSGMGTPIKLTHYMGRMYYGPQKIIRSASSYTTRFEKE